MPNAIIGTYSGGDIGYPIIDIPVPLSIVKDEGGVIYTGMNVLYVPGANAQQINAAMVQKAIERCAEHGITVTANNVIYQPFARG